MSIGSSQPPLVAHIIHRLDVGGLENGLVNIINRTPPERYRHAIICMTDYNPAFRARIRREGVECHALHKREGKDLGVYFRLRRLLIELRPDIVHTRNLSALEAQLPAWLAGVRCRVHGEHGRDVHDIDGRNRKYNLLRRALRPLVDKYIPLSRDLEQWLKTQIGVPEEKIVHICNGVDSMLFHPAAQGREPLPAQEFADKDSIVIGTLGRMQTVKDQLTLVRAFLLLLDSYPDARQRLRLALIGDGPLREQAQQLLRQANALELCWLPGSRDDAPGLLRGLDIFVLPSLAEGISNTILEAMASGLPVVATQVGGNPELVLDGGTGVLVPPDDPRAMADALWQYLDDQQRLCRHGAEGRRRIEQEFSLERMVEKYLGVYDAVLLEKQGTLPLNTARRG
ncbi:MAG: TIGR03088 family PEP-CTERM/XrtA system glycosyltransferase [Pseudomonadota bacterium]